MIRSRALRAFWAGDPGAADVALAPLQHSFLTFSLLPMVRIAQGRVEEARASLDLIRPRVADRGHGGVWMLFAMASSDVLDRLGRGAEAARLYDGLMAHRGWVLDWWLPEIQLGMIAAACGRWRDAFARFEEAIGRCDSQGLLPHAAVARAPLWSRAAATGRLRPNQGSGAHRPGQRRVRAPGHGCRARGAGRQRAAPAARPADQRR